MLEVTSSRLHHHRCKQRTSSTAKAHEYTVECVVCSSVHSFFFTVSMSIFFFNHCFWFFVCVVIRAWRLINITCSSCVSVISIFLFAKASLILTAHNKILSLSLQINIWYPNLAISVITSLCSYLLWSMFIHCRRHLHIQSKSYLFQFRIAEQCNKHYTIGWLFLFRDRSSNQGKAYSSESTGNFNE